MSSFDFDFPDEVVKMIEEISKDDSLAIECLESVRDITRESVATELHKHDDTGEMANSVQCKEPTQNADGDGYHIFAHPTGYSKKNYKRKTKRKGTKVEKVSNGLKAVWLEYGNSHQAPKPWLAKAKNNCEDKVIETMQETMNKRVGDK